MPLSPTGWPGASSSGLLSASVTLTDAQIKTLPTAAITLVAAPGAGMAILPIYGLLVAHFAAGGYAGGANEYFTVGTGVDAAELMGATQRTLIDGAVAPLLPTIASLDSLGYRPVVIQSGPQLTNQALTISASAAGNWTGGGSGNTLVVTVLYLVVAV